MLQGVTPFCSALFEPRPCCPQHHTLASGSELFVVLFLPHLKAEGQLNAACRAVSSAPSLDTTQAGYGLREDAENEARWAA